MAGSKKKKKQKPNFQVVLYWIDYLYVSGLEPLLLPHFITTMLRKVACTVIY